MDEAVMRRCVAGARVGRLATVTSGGRPHVVPCCFVMSDGLLYSAVDAKPKSTLALRRLDNIRTNPAAALLVDHYEEDWGALWWVRVDGHARVVTDGAERDGALAALAAKYEQYRREPPPGPVIALDGLTWRAWP